MMKKILAILLCVLLPVLAAGCGEKQPDAGDLLNRETDDEADAGEQLSDSDYPDDTNPRGWWIRPEDWPEDEDYPIILVSTFETWTPYTPEGLPGAPNLAFHHPMEPAALELDEEETFRQLTCRDNTLVNDETGEVEYVRLADPPRTWDWDLEGRWWSCGDQDTEYWYDLEDGTYEVWMEFMDWGEPMFWGSWFYCEDAVPTGDGSYLTDVPCICATGCEDTLFLDRSRTLLMARDQWGLDLFVREDAIDEELLPVYESLEYLLNNQMQTNWEGRYNTQKIFQLTPWDFGIEVVNHGEQPDADDWDVRETHQGTWELTGEGGLLLHFSDGTEEEVPLSDGLYPMVMETVPGEYF